MSILYICNLYVCIYMYVYRYIYTYIYTTYTFIYISTHTFKVGISYVHIFIYIHSSHSSLLGNGRGWAIFRRFIWEGLSKSLFDWNLFQKVFFIHNHLFYFPNTSTQNVYRLELLYSSLFWLTVHCLRYIIYRFW